MTSKIILQICNDIDDSLYKRFNSMQEYIESTLNEDKELYKYLPLENTPGYIENVIRDSNIKFGAPNKFNDPFECMSVIGIESFHTTKKKLEELIEKSGREYSEGAFLRAYDKVVGHSIDYFREKALPKYGVLCLSGKWDEILMWAHYSNEHRGIVLIFQFDRGHSFYDKMMKVVYKKGVTYFEIDNPNCAKKFFESFSTKDPIWEYENEYRIINPPSNPESFDGHGIKQFPRDLLKGIIFGCRILPEVRESIIKMVAKYNNTPKLYDIIIDRDEIKLHKVPLD